MSSLTKPAHISAHELKNWVGYSHCGPLDMKVETFHGRKWKQRYAIMSKGWVYIYMDKYSKKPEKAYKLSACESVRKCQIDDEEEDGFSFFLVEIDKKHVHFSCDTAETREVWLQKIRAETLHNLSADSGYGGSASSIQGTTPDYKDVQGDSYTYVENHRETKRKESLPVQPCDASAQYSPHPHETLPKTLATSERDPFQSESEFVSVRGGIQNVSLYDSVPVLSVRGQNSVIGNEDSVHSETMFENPEKVMKKFTREDNQSETKERAKKVMEGKPVGTFVVYPGEETRQTLCVMTPKGLKFFRIHEQEEWVSLFKDFSSAPKVFRTLDHLLFHYHYHDLPGYGYSVQLKE